MYYVLGLGVPRSNVEAYFWLSLATASAKTTDQTLWTSNRDKKAEKLTQHEKSEVQRRLNQWLAAHS
jgi:hypothetical protein